MAKRGKFKELLLKLLKSPSFYFCVSFVLLNLFFTKAVLNANGIGGFVPIACVEVVLECLCIFVIYKMQQKDKPLEKQFLFLALVLGLLFAILLPPGQSPDEITHFRRVYGISEGILIPDEAVNSAGAIGSWMPKNTNGIEKLQSSKHGSYTIVVEEITKANDELVGQAYTSAALYNPICYIPQVLAALIGKIFGMSVMGMAFLMTIFNFALWVVLIYYAIKVIPKFKSIVAFIALLPITLQEATSISPDAITIGLSVFMVAYILYLAYGDVKKLETKHYVILSLCALVIGFCKIVYLPLILLMIVIPKKKFVTTKRKWVYLGVLFGVVAILNLIWLVISSRYLVEYREGVNSSGQLMGILSNPFKYLMVMFNTVNVSGQVWIENMLGMTFGSFTFNLPSLFFLIAFVFTVLLFAQRDDTLQLGKYDKWVFAGVFLIIFVLILTSLYLQWTPQGSNVVEGIQGRYFLPILVLIPVVLCRSTKSKIPTMVSDSFVLYFALFVNVLACVTIFAQNI